MSTGTQKLGKVLADISQTQVEISSRTSAKGKVVWSFVRPVRSPAFHVIEVHPVGVPEDDRPLRTTGDREHARRIRDSLLKQLARGDFDPLPGLEGLM